VIFLHINQKLHVPYNFNCLIDTEVIVNVTGSDVYCKCGNISETR